MEQWLNAETLHAASQCGIEHPRPQVSWIDSAGEWNRFHGRLTSQRMGSFALPPPDFTREGVLFIAMGQRPSGGFYLNFTPEPVLIQDAILTVTVNWHEPPPGYRQAQVITSPCLLLKLPKVSFEHIRILDQKGRLRITAQRG